MNAFMDEGRGSLRWNLESALDSGQDSWFAPLRADPDDLNVAQEGVPASGPPLVGLIDAFEMVREQPSLLPTDTVEPGGEAGAGLPLDAPAFAGFFVEARLGNYRGQAPTEDFRDMFLRLPEGEQAVEVPLAGGAEADGLLDRSAAFGGGDDSPGIQAPPSSAALVPHDAWFGELSSTFDPWG